MDSNKEITRTIGSILLLAFSAFAIISLFSHSPNDPPFADYPINNPVKNPCGKAGANLSGYMLLGLGITAYVPFLFLGTLGALSILKREIRYFWLKVTGVTLVIISAPPVIYLVSDVTGSALVSSRFAGIFGLIAAIRLTQFIGIAGTSIVLGVSLIIAVLLIANTSIGQLFTKLFNNSASGEGANAGNVIAKAKVVNDIRSKRSSLNISSFLGIFSFLNISSVLKAVPISRLWDKIVKNSPFRTTEKTNEPITTPKITHSTNQFSNTQQQVDSSQDERPDTGDDDIAANVISVTTVANRNSNGGVKVTTARSDDGSQKAYKNYKLPTIDLLEQPEPVLKADDNDRLMERANVLQMSLKQFNVDVEVAAIVQGPVITMFELELSPGTKVAKIIALSDDLAIAMKAPSVRVVAPLPNKSAVGLEVPNANRRVVRLKEVINSGTTLIKKQTIPLVLGKDVAGNPLISDMTAMPHLLIAGTTGSGKSVCLNTIILSVLCFQRPDNVKLLLVDPKMVEFAPYSDIPHLITPIVTDMKKAAAVLEWAVNKMEERYALLSSVKVRNIDGYNALGEGEIRRRIGAESDANLDEVPFHLPYIILVVDELADLMMIAAKEVESSVIRLSQKSRAVGIHLILATQRPSVNVVTGLIKSNMPARISFFVASKIDSRTILDQNGAEKLLGAGDLLFLPPGTSKLVRAQSAFVSDDEVNNVVNYLKERSAPDYSPDLKAWKGSTGSNSEPQDELYSDAVRVVLESQRGSVSLVQRRLGIGYSRAARLVELMGEDGIIGEYKGSQAREVFYTLEEWENFGHNDKD